MHNRAASRAMSPGRPSEQPPGGTKPVSMTVRGPGAEDLLQRYVALLSDVRAGQRAVRFYLSRLQPLHRRDKHILIATNMLEELVGPFPGKIFALPSADVVVICKGITQKVIDDGVEVLRYLFNDDPLIKLGGRAGEFFAVYDLQLDYDGFVASLPSSRPAKAESLVAGMEAAGDDAFDPSRLAGLLNAIGRLDLSALVRRQTIWAMLRDKAPRPMMDELFVSIGDLRQAPGMSFDPDRDRQLFQYMTRRLDQYVLSTLMRDHSDTVRPLSINVNLATIRSADFRKFEERRTVAWRNRLMMEFQLADMWLDFPAFLAAMRRLHERGYLRCLDGVIYNALPYLKFERLDVDFVKVIWDDALLQLDEPTLEEFCTAIRSGGVHRIILTRCGRPEAIHFGQAVGIQFFQGRAVDRANQVK